MATNRPNLNLDCSPLDLIIMNTTNDVYALDCNGQGGALDSSNIVLACKLHNPNFGIRQSELLVLFLALVKATFGKVLLAFFLSR